MSETTKNLGLFKYIPETDGKQVFSIVQALNNNWDILDEKGAGSGFNLFDTKLVDHVLEGKEAEGWALQGTWVNKNAVAGSSAGYPDFYNKCLEEFENSSNSKQYLISNVTYVGSVTDNQGVLSGFGASNYVQIGTFSPNSQPYEIVIKFKTSSVSTSCDIIGSSVASSSGAYLVPQLRISSSKLTYHGTNSNTITSITTLQNNTWYWVKFTYNGSQRELLLSTDGKTYNSEGTIQGSITIQGGTLLLGNGGGESTFVPFVNGSIDLNESYININGERWWTGVDNLEYKKNSNGHLFYDISQKDIVDNIFSSTGMAWMYGVDKDNERIFLPRNNFFEQTSGNVSEVGKSIKAGLPNITGRFDRSNRNGKGAAEGAFYNGAAVGGFARHGDRDSSYVEFDASLSNPIYGNSDTVQPNAVNKLLYICVANNMTQQALGDVVEVTTTENDTIPLFTGMYFDFKPNNACWLKAGEQQNDAGIYKTCYAELVNVLNGQTKYGNLKVIDTSNMIAGVDYSEYWKVNQDEMTFITPTAISNKALSGAIVGNGMTLGLTDGTQYTGVYYSLSNHDVSAENNLYGTNVGTTLTGVEYPSNNLTLGVTPDPTKSGIIAEQSTAQLYFKVANAVQNLELLDVGTVMEQAVLRTSLKECSVVVETYQKGTSWYRVWSDGWCEQGGINSGTPTINLLKPFTNTEYNILLTRRAQSENVPLATTISSASFVVNWKIVGQSLNANTVSFSWQASGYIK